MRLPFHGMTFSPTSLVEQTQHLQRAHQRSLEMLESGNERDEILTFLTEAAEQIAGPGSAASILLLDDEGLLRNGVSPKLPDDYLAAIDGLRPDARIGTCAAAAATGKVIVTPDFRTDDKWAELRHLPLALGYAGAWSIPIKTRDGRVLGTFGTYFRNDFVINMDMIDRLGLLASAAAVVVERGSAAR